MPPGRSHIRVRLLREVRGVNLVEAAIVTPLLVLLTFAIIEFATLLYVHEALQNGVSQATRFAITGRLKFPFWGFGLPPLPGGGGGGGRGDWWTQLDRTDHRNLLLADHDAIAEAVLSDGCRRVRRRIGHEKRGTTGVMSLHEAREARSDRGQSLLEFVFVVPLLLVIAFGVADVGLGLLDAHTVTRLSREGSNLISRNTTLADAAVAVETMSNGPVDFASHSKLIFSVIKRGATTGSPNYDKLVLYQRHEFGNLAAASKLHILGSGSFGGAPDYVADDSDNNTGLQISGLPADLVIVPGGLLYVTEVFTRHERFTPLDRFGVTVPEILYSIAYF
jgi:Flp pilus assembly protein TadG